MAGKLIPAVNMMRDGILFLAGGGKRSPSQVAGDIANIEYGEAAKPIIDRKRQLANQRAGELSTTSSRFNNMTPEEQDIVRRKRAQNEAEDKSLSDQLKGLEAARDAKIEATKPQVPKAPGSSASDPSKWSVSGAVPGAGAGLDLSKDKALRDELAKTDRMLGLPAGTSAAQMQQESGFNPNARSNKGAMGLAQVMPKTLLELERRFGRKLNPYDPKDAVLIQRELMRENMAKFGNVKDALSAYNGGWDPSRWRNSETSAYAPKILRNASSFATPLPEDAPKQAESKPQKVTFEHQITLNDKNGVPIAPASTVSKTVRAPAPFGA
jgi:hypothetical protein